MAIDRLDPVYMKRRRELLSAYTLTSAKSDTEDEDEDDEQEDQLLQKSNSISSNNLHISKQYSSTRTSTNSLKKLLSSSLRSSQSFSKSETGSDFTEDGNNPNADIGYTQSLLPHKKDDNYHILSRQSAFNGEIEHNFDSFFNRAKCPIPAVNVIKEEKLNNSVIKSNSNSSSSHGNFKKSNAEFINQQRSKYLAGSGSSSSPSSSSSSSSSSSAKGKAIVQSKVRFLRNRFLKQIMPVQKISSIFKIVKNMPSFNSAAGRRSGVKNPLMSQNSHILTTKMI